MPASGIWCHGIPFLDKVNHKVNLIIGLVLPIYISAMDGAEFSMERNNAPFLRPDARE